MSADLHWFRVRANQRRAFAMECIESIKTGVIAGLALGLLLVLLGLSL